MTSPEINFSDKEQRLLEAIEGKDPYFVFKDGDGRGFNGPSAYRAFAYPDKFALHKWSTDDGETVKLLGNRIVDGDTTRGYRPELLVIGEGIPAYPGVPAQPEMKYRGLVSREEALEIALGWLEEYGSDEKFDEPEQDPDEIVGVFDGPAGPVFVTGIGASIFGDHISAMQEQGVADYFPLNIESDS